MTGRMLGQETARRPAAPPLSRTGRTASRACGAALAAVAVLAALSCVSSLPAGTDTALYGGPPLAQPGLHAPAPWADDRPGAAWLPFHAPPAYATHVACRNFSSQGYADTVTVTRTDGGTPVNGTYYTGDSLDIRVDFVTVVPTANLQSTSEKNIPDTRILMETGDTDRNATYVSYAGKHIIFRYTVQSGDRSDDLDYQNMYSSADSLQDDWSNGLRCYLPRTNDIGLIAQNYDIVVRGIAIGATVESVRPSASTPNGTYGFNRGIEIDVRFNETVTVTPSASGGLPYLELETTPARNATFVDGSGTATLKFLYRV